MVPWSILLIFLMTFPCQGQGDADNDKVQLPKVSIRVKVTPKSKNITDEFDKTIKFQNGHSFKSIADDNDDDDDDDGGDNDEEEKSNEYVNIEEKMMAKREGDINSVVPTRTIRYHLDPNGIVDDNDADVKMDKTNEKDLSEGGPTEDYNGIFSWKFWGSGGSKADEQETTTVNPSTLGTTHTQNTPSTTDWFDNNKFDSFGDASSTTTFSPPTASSSSNYFSSSPSSSSATMPTSSGSTPRDNTVADSSSTTATIITTTTLSSSSSSSAAAAASSSASPTPLPPLSNPGQCGRSMMHTRQRECVPYQLSLQNVFSRFSKLYNLVVNGCPKKEKDDNLCCHTHNNTMHQFLRDLSSQLSIWEEKLRGMCECCPVDCKWAEWGSWSDCPLTCASGERRSRTREIAGPFNGGRLCNTKGPKEEQHEACPTPPKSEREWSNWTDWTPCSAECGGHTHRTRECPQDNKPCSTYCQGDAIETQTCGNDCCVNARWSAWGAWSECPQPSTLYGTQSPMSTFRNRTCDALETEKPICPGQCVGIGTQVDSCPSCVPSVWLPWGPWTKCSNAGVPRPTFDADGNACNTGQMTRTRACKRGTCKTLGCTGDDKAVVNCNLGPCCVKAQWSEWTDWTDCNTNKCKNRHRSCVAPDDTGINYTHPRPVCKRVGCRDQTPEIEVKDCFCATPSWTGWGAWSECQTSTMTRKRNRIDCYSTTGHLPHCRDLKCPPAYEEKQCECVPVHGDWGSWCSWTHCSATCGDGTRSRYRRCDNPAPNSCGRNCSGMAEIKEKCNQGSCCGTSTWKSWGPWGPCSQSCGNGIQLRYRSCDLNSSSQCYEPCVGSDVDRRECQGDVPVHGDWGSWCSWTHCSATCGDGTRSRYRRCDNPAPNSCGRNCSGMAEIKEKCNQGSCCVNGNWGPWGHWGACSVTCGKGKQSRHRLCDSPSPDHCGMPCQGDVRSQRVCQVPDCCATPSWRGWSAWSECQTSTMTRKRNRTECYSPTSNQPNCRHLTCPPAYEEKRCDCDPGSWSAWSVWSSCTCTTTTRSRNRYLVNTIRALQLCKQDLETQKDLCPCCESCNGLQDGAHLAKCEAGCRNYIVCCNGKVRQGSGGQCQRPNEVFHPACGNCVRQDSCPSSYNIRCPDRTNQPMDPRQLCDGCQEPCTGKQDGYYASRCTFDCRSYFRCRNGRVVTEGRCNRRGQFYDACKGCCVNYKPRTCIIGRGDSHKSKQRPDKQRRCYRSLQYTVI